MLIFILTMAVMNAIGGRFEDVAGTDTKIPGRLLFRCVLPACLSGCLAVLTGHSFFASAYIIIAVLGGSALWFAPGWSFDEIDGGYDKTKYPAVIRQIGEWLVPVSLQLPADNRERGIYMKGLRGLYDALTFIALAAINPYALLVLPLCAFMGAIYWLAGRIAPARKAVMVGEFLYGGWRGWLLAMAI